MEEQSPTAPARPGFLPPRTPAAPPSPVSPPSPVDRAAAADLAAEPEGLRGRLNRLRERAAGDRRPLASPEATGALDPDPKGSGSSRGSTRRRRRLRRLVETTALGFRQVTKGIQAGLGERTGLDWVATPTEAIEVGAPLAAELRDRAEVSAVAAAAAERSNLIAAGLAMLAYLMRVLLGQAGGSELDAQLEERIADRLARAGARKRAKEAAAGGKPAKAPAEEYGEMIPGGI